MNEYFDLVRDLGGEIVEHVQLLDTYDNEEKFGIGKISYTFRIVYRSYERTLLNDEINAVQEKIRTTTAETLNASLR